jgi:hypothetical protein
LRSGVRVMVTGNWNCSRLFKACLHATHFSCRTQGCQMVYLFRSLGKFLSLLMEDVRIFYEHLVYFTAI